MTGGNDKLANSAHADFVSGNYKACLEKLHTLQRSNPNDPKIKHNLLLTKYCAVESGTRPCIQTTLESFTRVLKPFATEQKDEQRGMNMEGMVAAFNKSLVLYSARQFHAAASELDRLLVFLSSTSDRLSQNICFLLLDVCLLIGDAGRAARAFELLDKDMVGIDKDEKDKDKDKEKSQPEEEISQFRFLFHLYKAKLYIMTRSFKLCKREMKSCLNASNSEPAGLFLKGNFEYLRKNHRKAIKLLNGCPNLPASTVLPVLYYNNLAIVHFQLNKPNMAAFYFAKAWKANEVLAAAQSASQGTSVLEADKRYELAYNHGLQLLYSGQPKAAFASFMRSIPAFRNESLVWLRLAECCVGVHATRRTAFNRASEPVTIVKKVVGTKPYKTVVISENFPDPIKMTLASGRASVSPGERQETMETNPVCGHAEPSLQFGLWCARNAMVLASAQQSRATEVQSAYASANASLAGNKDDDSGNHGNQNSNNNNSSTVDNDGDGLSGPDAECVETTIQLNIVYLSLHLCDYNSALSVCKDILTQRPSDGNAERSASKSVSPTLRCIAQLYAGEALIRLGRIQEAEHMLSPTAEGFEGAFLDVTVNMNDPYTLPHSTHMQPAALPGSSSHNSNANNGRVSVGSNNGSTQQSSPGMLANSSVGGGTKCANMLYSSRGVQSFVQNSPQTAFKAQLLINLAVGFCRRGDFDRAENAMIALMRLLPPTVPYPPQAVLIAVYMDIARGNSVNALRMVKQHSLPLSWTNMGQNNNWRQQ
ncbi:hypothetical protein SARC_01792 [Sphaeroforma arctica JP610]|uniref:CCR4-NOT transcription complex subunit 10 n=1 Tax=Sphaeroforma arctica JP610 TaxID=667725 RepID=A0A0L0GCS1_9EUKA|nr:hypothetical protein SARC_01792 [Sphaeroforma arctica JP610]KNC86033.1 hypothetical protein SARC_01792 [Sphaeroforma arctica JP610]|eukprot:XP_014159935.1 hypothetical protein SARC_01792 [Sphaeroforma arctica JP610]